MSADPSAPTHMNVVFASMAVLHPEQGDLAKAIIKDIPIIKAYQPEDLEIRLRKLRELELHKALKNRNIQYEQELSRQLIETHVEYNEVFIQYLDILIHWFDLFIKRLNVWLSKMSDPNCEKAQRHIEFLKNALVARNMLLPGESFHRKRWNLVKTKTLIRAEMMNVDYGNILRFFKINVDGEDVRAMRSELLKKFAEVATENRLASIRPFIEFSSEKEEFEKDFYP